MHRHSETGLPHPGRYLAAVLAVGMLTVACAPATPAAPTAAPPTQPAESKPAAKPTAKAAAQPTTAPAAKAVASPAAKAVASPAAKAVASPAAKAATKPAAKAATFDEQAIASFYGGKTIRIVAGFSSGGLFDTWARILSRHMPKHIPGNPNMIVENMTGAASMVAANHLFNVAPKDGTVFGTFNEGMVMNQLTSVDGVQFKSEDFNWVGAISDANIACMARSDLGKGEITFQRLLGANPTELVVGASGPGNSGYDYPKLFKELAGANFNIVSGYAANAQVRLAVESGEVDGYCGTWEAMRPTTKPWVEAGTPKFTIIVQEGARPHPELPGVPMGRDFVANPDDKALIELQNGVLGLTRPFALPPGVPAERVAALRQAFLAIFQDPELIAEAQRAELDYQPRSGDEVLSQVRAILQTPRDRVERLKAVLAP